ncbi:MAG: hypothetical protein IJG40_07460, partial [Oscillospiraceae bacterium]|nr:hypothetical protein [Oscillospiraceae bacterium]
LPVYPAQYDMINPGFAFSSGSSWHKHHPVQYIKLSFAYQHKEPSPVIFVTLKNCTIGILQCGWTNREVGDLGIKFNFDFIVTGNNTGFPSVL